MLTIGQRFVLGLRPTEELEDPVPSSDQFRAVSPPFHPEKPRQDFVSQSVNLIIPARLGDFVRIFILKHDYNSTYSEGVSSLVVERIFDLFTVALLGAVAIFFVLNAPPWFYTIIVFPIVAGVIFFTLLLFMGKFSSENRYIAIVLTILHEIKRASLSSKAIVLLGFSSGIIWFVDILVCVTVVMMFQQQIPFAIIVLAIVIGTLVKAVPLAPGGVGTYEISLAITFGLAGVDPAAATLIAIIDHLIKNLVTDSGSIFRPAIRRNSRPRSLG